MAGEFIDPASNANLDQLMGELRAQIGTMEGLLARSEATAARLEGAGSQQAAASAQQARTAAGPSRTADQVKETSSAVRQELAGQQDLNAAIAREVELRAQAVAETRAQSTLGAAQRVQRAVEGTPAPAPVVAAPPAAAEQAARRTAAADTEALAMSEGRLGAATQRSILLYSQANNSLQAHGAMTTEFLSAAARGQVTLREFGDQIGQTTAKFGGWLVAAAAVYGVIGAVSELGRGALDASNSVGQLSRTIEPLNRLQATQKLVELAHQTNTSMKEAGDAVFMFSRTFHTLDDATTVARLGLMAFKLDGVELADTVKAVTAIHQQFGVSAQGMKPVFDELAAGQREFNARMTEQIPLLQRSASAVKNAGGDLQTYIQLSTIALRTTQLSGSQLGTAFLRSASTFLNPQTTKGAADRQVLASLGINPNQNYTDLIVDALKRSASLSDAQRQTLSQAVFGPLLGGRTAGFFTGGPQLLDEVQKKLEPGAVKHTFLDEFAKELGTSKQQLEAVVNNTQQLGAALSQSGLLAPVGLFVKGLNEGLTVTTQLLDLWNKMPGPIKEVAGLMAGFAAVRAVGGKMGIDAAWLGLQGRAQGAALTKGLGEEQGFYQGQYVAAGRAEAMAGIETQKTLRVRNAAAISGTEEELAAASQAYEAALIRELSATVQREALGEQAAATQERLVFVQTRINEGMSAQAAAAAWNQSLGAGREGEAIYYMRQGRGYGQTGGTGVVPFAAAGEATFGTKAATGASAAAAGETAATTTSLEAQAIAMRNLAAQQTALAEGLDVDSVALTEEAGASAAVTASAARAAATTDEAIATSRGAGIGVLSAGISRAVPWIFGLGIAFEGVKSAVDAIGQTAKDSGKAIDYQAKSMADAQQHVQTLKDKADAQFKADTLGGIPMIGGIVSSVAEKVDRIIKGPDWQPNEAAQAAEIQKVLWQRRQDQQITATSLPGPSIDPLSNIAHVADSLFGGGGDKGPKVSVAGEFTQLEEQAKSDTAMVQNTDSSRDAWYTQLRQLKASARSIATDAEQGKSQSIKDQIEKGLKTFNDDLQNIYEARQALFEIHAIDAKQPFKQFETQDPKAISKSVQADADRAQIYGAKPQDLNQMAYALTYLTMKASASHDPALLEQVMQAQSSYITAVKKNAENLVNEASTTYDPGKYAQLLQQATSLVKLGEGKLQGANAAVKRQMDSAQTTYSNAVKILAEIDQELASGSLSLVERLLLLGAQAGWEQTVSQDFGKLKDAKKLYKSTVDANKQQFDQLNAELKSINQAKTGASDPLELIRLQRQIQQAQAEGNPVLQAQIGEQLAQQEMSAARTEKDKLQARYDLINAENQYYKALEDRTQAYYSYLETTTQDPVAQAAYQMQAAAEQLRNAIAHGGTGTQAYWDAMAKVNQSQQAQAQAVQDRTQAYYSLQESQTEDPIRQATIAMDADRQAIAWAAQTYGTNSKEYFDALGKYNKDAQGLSQAIEDRTQALYSMRESATQDPLKQDRIAMQAADEAVSYAADHFGTDSKQYYDAVAKKNESRQKLRDQILTGKEDDVKFHLDMGQISIQAAIEEYQALLRMHNLTKAQRQQILEQIHQWKTQGQSDFGALDLGTLRLPTPYEIRRALLAGQQGTSVTQHFNTNINVPDAGAAERVGVVMDRYTTGVGKAIERATGSR